MKKMWNEKTDENLSVLYRAAFNEINAPDDLYGKVIKMDTTKKITGLTIFKRIAIAVLVLAVVAFGSNAIVYASTGTGWIGRIIISWNGSAEAVDFHEETNSLGETYYVGNVQYESGDALTFVAEDPELLNNMQIDVADGKISVTDKDGNTEEYTSVDQYEEFSIGLAQVTPLPEKDND